ncbi:hypothetical protein G9A89_003239 [Geosiphon pyriformis]|nr:hypothetical protein G9A89_003239 [Geosiphon pyriformis]
MASTEEFLKLQIKYLKSLRAIRARSLKVYEKSKTNQLNHFEVDFTKLDNVIDLVISLIKRDYEDASSIPPHSRWRHFDVGGKPRVQSLIESWEGQCEPVEMTRRVLDLFVVSVLLDAGAGATWSYKESETGQTFKRSEGLAIASLDMFNTGFFSSQEDQPHRVDADKLVNISVDDMAKAFQVDNIHNPLDGLEGRANLICRLGESLKYHQEFFGGAAKLPARPGNIIDYLLEHPTTQKPELVVKLDTLWSVIIDGLSDVWPPTRTSLGGVSLGDVWACEVLREPDAALDSTEHLVPFHKLSQWLTYSLMEPMNKIMGIKFEGVENLTGLPEYRNGGLFVDTGLLTLKPVSRERGLANFKGDNLKNEAVPVFEVDDPVIIEWRALTVILLDVVTNKIKDSLDQSLVLTQILEAGTWKAGREIAEKLRPKTKGPPISIKSDGTVF